ncbi:MAG: AarF/ABC1/UbiB kinase family protein [Actinobacteria bacterium]|nr:AarF/ABC1/UbiB kinase family protein [Actinomycetota bacterium]NBP21919.1 AarF/ABC1/UbiB kinase family protein [Actinomycetota bacterium]NBY50088.1 AarF/ABC1/UbiB kinase family protein [Actinomycetota bacterium]NCY11021.1 AarF/ABC1/UbiB kinase family protein [Actinomycetota bacterium]NDA36015.1 AarF/ABC1/UbiB kinase family protein [Actinomycetota bacterium]
MAVSEQLPQGTSKRSAKMASIPLSLAGRGAIGLGRQLIGQSPEFAFADLQEKTAEQIFKVLGELKGGAMKFGQALSVFEAALPEEIAKPYRETLVKLQEAAPPLPARVVHKVLAKELGEHWRDNFAEFNDIPAASASIGQVHKGIWKDGRAVAVKIQYPGAKEALISDLNQIQRFAKIFQLLLPGVEMKPLLEELKTRIIEEVDYRYEASAQSACFEAYKDDSDIAIPEVIMATDRVLVSQWLEGTPLSKVIADGTQQERNNAGIRLARFHFTAPMRAGLLHADPHPGNFRVLKDGRLGVLDFGACNRLPNGFPEPFKRLLRNALEGDAIALYNGFKEDGFILSDVEVDPKLVLDYLLPLVEPLRTDYFAYSRDWLRTQSLRVGDPRNPTAKIGFQLNLPAEYVLIHRVTLGTTGIFCQLRAEGNFRDEALSWFPEITPSHLQRS